MKRQKRNKLEILEKNSITCPSCSLCKAKQVPGIKLYDRDTLEIRYECEECVLTALKEKKRLKDEKRKRREKAIAEGKFKGKPEEDRYMLPEEWPLFEQAIYEPIYYILWLILWSTGARINEALQLTTEDFNLGENKVTITSLKRRDHLKVEYPLPSIICKAIKTFNKKPGEKIFTNKKKKAITLRMAQNKFKTTCRRAGIRTCLSPHSIRHLFTQRAWKKTGGDMKLTAKMLRHKYVSTLEHYLHLTPREKEKVANELNEEWGCW